MGLCQTNQLDDVDNTLLSYLFLCNKESQSDGYQGLLDVFLARNKKQKLQGPLSVLEQKIAQGLRIYKGFFCDNVSKLSKIIASVNDEHLEPIVRMLENSEPAVLELFHNWTYTLARSIKIDSYQEPAIEGEITHLRTLFSQEVITAETGY